MSIERYTAVAPVEIHASDAGPGVLRGVLVTFGEATRDSRRHVFAPGSLEWDPAGVELNRAHDPGSPIDRIRPALDGDRIVVDHALPDTRAGRDAAAEVRRGLMRGLSVEVEIHADRHVSGRREIDRATVHGVGLVTRPAFVGSTVTVHGAQGDRRRRVWL